MASLEDVLISDKLPQRPARPPNYEAEHAAFIALARVAVESPETILQRLAETALELCAADSAGVSLIESQAGEPVFRWHATAGRYSPDLLAMTPRDFGACAITVERKSPQLFADPARHFLYLKDFAPPITEQLLVPFFISGRAVGAIWLLTNRPDRHFDTGDVRIVSDLALVCAAGLQAVHVVNAPEAQPTLADEVIDEQAWVKQGLDRRARMAERRIAAARSEAERKFQLLIQNITDYAMMMLDGEGHITAWNEGAARLKGYSPDEVLGKHFSLFYPPEELAVGRWQQELATARATGRSEVEGFRVRKDGSRFWVNEIITAIRDEAGAQIGFAKISRDLTQQKAMQDALRESEERHRLLVENARDYAIVMIDIEGRILSWNTGAERVFGYPAHEIVGRESWVLFTPEDRESRESEKELSTAASEGRAIDERWQMRKGGERFWASGVTTPMRDTDGTLRGFAKICRDLTDKQALSEQRERLFEQERAARMEAERAIQMKDEFLAMVSHELRTPLTAILLWSNLLKIGAVQGPDIPDAIESIEQSALAQQQLVDDLLDISRIVSGKMRINVRGSEVLPVLDAAVDTVRPMAEAKGVEIRVAADPNVGAAAIDPDRMQQVIWNLLTNAVKFTDRGGSVDIGLERSGGVIRIRVSDNGIGISSDFLPHVFEVFRQAHAGTNRQHGGLGLGMAITRQLVELHGGTITVTSPGEGKGTTFAIEFPVRGMPVTGSIDSRQTVAPQVDGAFQMRPILEGVRVLLVEDEPHTRQVVTHLLQACSAQVVAVESAAQAVATFRESQRGEPFDIIVSDIGMPVQDGYELMRELRQMEKARGDQFATPAVALTAYARPDDRLKAVSSGFQLHLSKPIDGSVLVEAVSTLARKFGAQ